MSVKYPTAYTSRGDVRFIISNLTYCIIRISILSRTDVYIKQVITQFITFINSYIMLKISDIIWGGVAGWAFPPLLTVSQYLIDTMCRCPVGYGSVSGKLWDVNIIYVNNYLGIQRF